MKLIKKIKSLFETVPPQSSPKMAPLDNFFRDPDACICDDRGRPFDWEARPTLYPSVSSLEDIRFISEGKTIGYAQQITMNSNFESACIGHFATHEEFTGVNVGRTMALSLKNQLQLRYQVNVIVFRESSYSNANANYGSFFGSLGATAHQEKRLAIPTWVWDFGNSQKPIANVLGSLPY